MSFDRREKLVIRPVRGKPRRCRLEITVNPRYEIVGAFAQEVRVDFVHFVPSATDYDRYVIRSGTIGGCDVTANAVRCHAE